MLSMALLGCRLLLIFTCCCYFPLVTVGAEETSPLEVNALKAIAQRLDDSMNSLTNWGKGDPCKSNWIGVICSDQVGSDGYLHVQELQMLEMNLSGSLAPELGQLSQLSVLNFMWNDLTGSIPKEIGNITNLTLLLLNGNKLTGSLPEELGFLSKLDRLQLDQNYLSGSIPDTFANLINVKHLHLNNNSFSGQIPPDLYKAANLLHLLIDNNNLSGHLPPELALLPNLTIIQLDNNNFNGSLIPTEYGRFLVLVKLSLRNSNLQGTVPDFSSIQTLLYLDLSFNNLSGFLPSILSQYMTTIDLSNNQFEGSIPKSFSNFSQIQRLSLENNFLDGSVSSDLWKNFPSNSMASFILDLRNNNLSKLDGGANNPPANVTLRLSGNPICNNNTPNFIKFCTLDSTQTSDQTSDQTFSEYSSSCPPQSCPLKNSYEYVSGSPSQCFCALPLVIGYRLKSPSFSSFPPYIATFKQYMTSQLNLSLYQLVIDSYQWEVGPRLRMELKIFPPDDKNHDNTFKPAEVTSIRHFFSTWKFKKNNFFGPYELLNFTLVGDYSRIVLEKPKKKNITGYLVGIMASVLILAVLATTLVTLYLARKKHRRKPQKTISSKTLGVIKGVKAFTFEELSYATDSFSDANEVGKGGYGKVYRGVLPSGEIIAVKRAEGGSLQGENEFMAEIHLLSRLHHKNLVSLLGFCDDDGEQMLVYEFMENGTLWDLISSKKSLDFYWRVRIALNSAKGILYLHTEADPPVFHRDIKSTNILLDSNFVAKVSDFGISRVSKGLDEYYSTSIRGTPGYMDPEYILTDLYSDKSDVYSLGVVFLELLTGRRPISHGKNIVREVSMMVKADGVSSVVDGRMGTYPEECLERFGNLALRCCQGTAVKRPSIEEVVRELDQIAFQDLKLKLPSDTDAFGTPTDSSLPFLSTSSIDASVSAAAHSADAVLSPR